MSECGNCGSPAAFALDVCAPCEQSARDAEAEQRELERMLYALAENGWDFYRWSDSFGSKGVDFVKEGRPTVTHEELRPAIRAAYAAAFPEGGQDGE